MPHYAIKFVAKDPAGKTVSGKFRVMNYDGTAEEAAHHAARAKGFELVNWEDVHAPLPVFHERQPDGKVREVIRHDDLLKKP